jgi:hypothetical protein
MKSRNKRRFATGVVSVGFVAVIAGAFLLFHHSHTAAPALSVGHTRKPSQPSVTQLLVYGMSKAEVLRRVGRQPTTTVGACWQYDENRQIGQHTITAERVCFLGGVYSYGYYKMDGQWGKA